MHFGSLQSCPTLHDPEDCSLPVFTVHGILQARILEWVTMPFSRVSSLPRDRTHISHIAGGFFTTEPPGKPHMLLGEVEIICLRYKSKLTSFSINENIEQLVQVTQLTSDRSRIQIPAVHIQRLCA